MSRRFSKVGVLMGGPSAEREISLKSGKAVVKGLHDAGYDVMPVDITERSLRQVPSECEAVFSVLHGEFGEDGQIQRLLDQAGLPYTGSGPEASRLAFDKVASKRCFEKHGIPTPEYRILGVSDDRSPPLPLPVVVKPARQGSSLGISFVHDPAQWSSAIATALEYDDQVVVESMVVGREITVGVVNGRSLPVVEIIAPNHRFDFEAKYTAGRTRYEVPAALPAAVAARARELALQVYNVLGCRGLGRVDFLVPQTGEPVALEMNTLPGFTATSLLPMAAGAEGISFAALCAEIMESAVVTPPSDGV